MRNWSERDTEVEWCKGSETIIDKMSDEDTLVEKPKV